MKRKPNAASVGLVRDGKMLLIERATSPFLGLWTFPGGRLEPGESAEDCARREILEEVGIRIGSLAPILDMDIGNGFVLAVFGSVDFSGTPTASYEVGALAWVEPASLRDYPTTPDLDMVVDRLFSILT